MSNNNFVRKFNNYDRESTMKNVENMNNIAAIATAKVNEPIANGFVFNFGTKSAIAPEKVIEKVRAHRGYKHTKADDIKRIVRKNDKCTGKVTYIVEFKDPVSKTADFKLKLN